MLREQESRLLLISLLTSCAILLAWLFFAIQLDASAHLEEICEELILMERISESVQRGERPDQKDLERWREIIRQRQREREGR